MTLPEIVTHDEWRAARIALLAEEKAMTKARDALSTKRRMLPMVRVDKEYQFAGPDGLATLIDLFDGRRQLIVQHFMFDPSWDDGCPSCTGAADEMSDGLRRHLQARDTNFAVVSIRQWRRWSSTSADPTNSKHTAWGGPSRGPPSNPVTARSSTSTERCSRVISTWGPWAPRG